MSDTLKHTGHALDLDTPGFYINRELSLLQFQRRVLEEAMDERNPLLERVKFIAIVGSNLDEFFMVRVGGLMTQINQGEAEPSFDGLTPSQQINEIRKLALQLLNDTQDYLRNHILGELHAAGIHIMDYDDLTPQQQQTADSYFHEVIFPVLTPLAFDPGHPFPHISNLSLNLAVLIKGNGEDTHFARLKIPNTIPYLLPVVQPDPGQVSLGAPAEYVFVWMSHVIRANLPSLFPGMQVIESHPFHLTRNAEVELQDFEVDDLLESMEENVRKRRFGQVVRLMISEGMPNYILEILADNMRVASADIYPIHGPLVLGNLMQLYKIDRPDLKYKPFTPAVPVQLKLGLETNPTEDSFFATIRRGNILLHHPYDSFNPIVDFLRAAARDPNVLAIKMTLYRTGSNSPVVKTLLQACRDYGKQVAVLVELKARFDEESNIGWAKMLEQEGVHVTYGLLGLKTHSKIALVVRKEGEHIRRYVHLSTGNYNHVTAQLYEDLSMFTCDDEFGADATDLFNYLTGYSLKQSYHKLLVAPVNLRQGLEELVRCEIEHQQANGDGHIIIKVNSLVDKGLIKELYRASQAGVKVDLIVRGMCSLRPGVPGLSENIRVISILGRYLEHSRIYYFRNGGAETIYMGSADLMPRNLNQRVEVLFPVEDANMVRHLRQDVLNLYLSDNRKARIMQSDGSYVQLCPSSGEREVVAQERFIAQAQMSSRI